MKERHKLFRALVKNGINFLQKSLDDLNEYPNFSIINFYTALELLLKARLMREHWTLILKPNPNTKGEKSFEDFKKGNFISVSLTDIEIRLKNVAQIHLPPNIWKCFKVLKDHRNRAVHFVPQNLGSDASNKERISIVREQLNGWYYLHELLTIRWKEDFKHALSDLKDLDKYIKERSAPYLDIVYSNIENDIKDKIQKGEKFNICPSCHKQSFKLVELVADLIFQCDCLVCNHDERSIVFDCEQCHSKVSLIGGGFGYCPKCNRSYDDKNIAQLYAFYLDDHMGSIVAHCSYCDSYDSVGYHEDSEKWFCANCLEVFDDVWTCECCNEANAGSEVEFSYITGCTICQGRYGSDED